MKCNLPILVLNLYSISINWSTDNFNWIFFISQSLKLWDISDGTCKIEVPNSHGDSVRCLAPDPSPNQRQEILLFASGSYDGYVKTWEFDVSTCTQNCLHKFLHGHPVESIAFFPKGCLLVTAGGPEVKVWDMVGGVKLLHSIQAHMKTVTCKMGDRVDIYRVVHNSKTVNP